MISTIWTHVILIQPCIYPYIADYQRTNFPYLTAVLCLVTQSYLFVTPRTAAHQTPLFMGFSRQEYWSGLPCPSPEPGIEPVSLRLLHWRWILYRRATGEAHKTHYLLIKISFIHGEKYSNFINRREVGNSFSVSKNSLLSRDINVQRT